VVLGVTGSSPVAHPLASDRPASVLGVMNQPPRGLAGLRPADVQRVPLFSAGWHPGGWGMRSAASPRVVLFIAHDLRGATLRSGGSARSSAGQSIGFLIRMSGVRIPPGAMRRVRGVRRRQEPKPVTAGREAPCRGRSRPPMWWEAGRILRRAVSSVGQSTSFTPRGSGVRVPYRPLDHFTSK
jgi:hypothetical protein